MGNVNNRNSTGIGLVRLIVDPEKRFGLDPHYWHVLARSGERLEDLLLTEQQYVEARARAARSNESLPRLSLYEWVKFRFPFAWVILIAALMAVAAGGLGCSTPSSSISSNPTTGEVKLNLPKDASWELLTYERFTDGKTNHVRLVISNANFKMNPEVINAAARREQAMFDLGMQAGERAIKAAAAGATGMPQKGVAP